MQYTLTLAVTLLAIGAACAAPAERAEPAQPQASAPMPAPRGSLSTYRRWEDGGPTDWRERNRRVYEAGGWRALAREPAPPASAAR